LPKANYLYLNLLCGPQFLHYNFRISSRRSRDTFPLPKANYLYFNLLRRPHILRYNFRTSSRRSRDTILLPKANFFTSTYCVDHKSHSTNLKSHLNEYEILFFTAIILLNFKHVLLFHRREASP